MLLLAQDKPTRGMKMDMERAENETAKTSVKDDLMLAYSRGERDFHHWNLDQLDLSGCELSECDFSDASMVGTNLLGANLKKAVFCKTDLTGATLSRAVMTGADLSWAKLSDATLVGVDLRRSQSRAANFSNALMIRARLNDADCLGANFTHVNATAAQFESCNLECTDFTHAMLMNANLCGANCSWTNFYEARLNWANLSWALLDAADMESANLTGASLRAANLNFANLNGAIFTGSDLYFANLGGALVPADALSAARISSSRLTSQTFVRSKWSHEDLRNWQQRGSVILDFGELPKEAQAFLRQGTCNLYIYFSLNIDPEYQVALETLILLLLGQETEFRILSIETEKSRSKVAFFAKHDEDIENYINCLKNKTWMDRSEEIQNHFKELKSPAHVMKFDVIHALTVLSEHIVHIQALIPLKDEQMRKLQSQVAPNDLVEDKAQISWSSVSLKCISRD